MKTTVNFNGQEKQVELTEAQARIVKRLQNGGRVTTLNEHYRDGGELVWYNENGYGWSKESVGYKAFWGAMRRIAAAYNLKDYEVARSFTA